MISERVMDVARLRDLEQQHFAQVLSRSSDVFVERGQGSYLYTPEGRRYLDFAMGIATVNTGHSHPRVIAAAKAQIDKLVHPSATAVHYAPNVELVARLAEITPGELNVTFLSNSGAEAVESSLKLARYVTGRPTIVAFMGGFHGRTMGALSVTSSKVHYRERYEPLMPSTYFAPFPHPFRCPLGHAPAHCCQQCLAFLERQFERVIDPHSVAAILVEPVQGEGGYIPAPPSFLAGLREICDRFGILLIFDEVQTGFGRTGKWWASQHYGVTPDIQVMAKAIASGFPLSAVSSTRAIMDAWLPGAHGSTYGGNPVSCAAACATIDVIREEGMIENAARMGGLLQDRLRTLQAIYPVIGEVRGLGLMVAAEFTHLDGSPNGAAAGALQRHCLEHNLILLTCGPADQTIRFIPPLNVSEAELDEGLAI
ncbi:MAG TPA: aminotransferase class III-fold pyridoxal phosphate-dependent enzyme, partial [Chloroflexota bacterium]|nr:aminotransferase class III-fold pyridoxal phosphate-dependent enzyme [Chloroflexota bacterium]